LNEFLEESKKSILNSLKISTNLKIFNENFLHSFKKFPQYLLLGLIKIIIMPYAIVLSFDEESSFPINQVFKKFKDKKIGSMLYEEKMKPHITLNNYETISIDTAKERLELFSIENKPLKIQISSIGYFPVKESVLFLNPKTSTELLNIQHKVFRLFKDFECEILPKTWVPHCTLGMYIQLKNLSRAIEIIKENINITKEKPFFVTTEAISFVKYERDPSKIDWWLDYTLKG